MNALPLGLLAALFLTPQLASAQSVEGFGVGSLSYPGQALTRTLSSGDIVTFDGSSIDRYDSNGVLVANLGGFSPPVFSGAFVVDPTESFCVVGESSFGDVYRVDLGGAGMTLLTNLVFNFDADFAPDGSVVVSAATGGFGTGNDLVRLDPLTGATTFLAKVSGPSGPLEFDSVGNLFYATIGSGFPAAPGSTDVLFFLAADLAGADCGQPGGCLDETDAIAFASGYDGASDLALDPQTGQLYMAENNFSSGASRIWAIAGGPVGAAAPFVEEATFNWTTGLEGFGGTSSATLQAFQPTSDARLLYNTTDFFSSWERKAVTAKRASLAISGPGLLGSGQVDLAITDAAAGGGALFFFGQTSLVSGTEVAYSLGGAAPLFTGLDFNSLAIYGGMLPLDGLGSTTFSFMNPGGLQGQLSIQALLFDTTGGLMLGTTNHVDF